MDMVEQSSLMEITQKSITHHSLEVSAKRTAVPFIMMVKCSWIIPHSLPIPQQPMVEPFTTIGI